MSKTGIEWCDETWSPVTGCTPISPGCANCYAKRMAETRLRGRAGYPQDEPFRVTVHEDRLDEPLRWRKSRGVVFCCSMGDLFHDRVMSSWDLTLLEIHRAILHASHTQFVILTKRPENAGLWYRTVWALAAPPIPNLTLGVSVENQAAADERIPVLLDIPVARRVVSCEPLLGELDLSPWLPMRCCIDAVADKECDCPGMRINVPGPYIDGVICGAETGAGARPMDPDWARQIRRDCIYSNTPFFFKKDSQGNRTLGGAVHEQVCWPTEGS